MDNGERVWRERALRGAVLAGDERAWRAWYDQEFPALYAYVSWRCGGVRDLTEEAVQDTWLIAVRRIRRFEPERGAFGTWLRGIAANVVRNQLRRLARQRRRTRPLNADLSSSSQNGEAACVERIARALGQLPERYEAVLRAKYLDQQSVAAIADAWKETPKAVESLLTRARQAFREAFQHGD